LKETEKHAPKRKSKMMRDAVTGTLVRL
jgi:hypothetical protein